MDVTNLMEYVSDIDLKIKDSILQSGERIRVTESLGGSLKRHISKTQIQWKEVPEEEERKEEKRYIKTSFPFLGLIAGHGRKWQYIHEAMLNVQLNVLKSGKQIDEEAHIAQARAYTYLIRELGSEALQKSYNKYTDLSLEHQTRLEILKHKVKADNEAYLRRHPEIGVMIKLVYTALFKNQPQNPKHFVSDYVHHLNKHREELVVEDVEIPFDKPPVPEEISSEDEERRQIREFARQIVENCLNLAALGESYVDVMSIINSMLKTVSPSEDEVSVKSVILNAETAVSQILMSLLTSVIVERSTSAELVADEVLNSILSTALPFVSSGSQVYSEMKESVENFIQRLINELTDNFWNRITLKEILSDGNEKKEINVKNEPEREEQRTILRKEVQDEDKTESRYKVKFQSIKTGSKL